MIIAPTPNPEIQATPFVSNPYGHSGARILYTRRARRILYGQHERLIVERLVHHLGVDRGDVVAKLVDLSTNTLKRAAASQATLYDVAPTFRSKEGDTTQLAEAFNEAGVWALMPRHQRDVLALRQGLMLCSIGQYGDEAPELVTECVAPDMFDVELDPSNPRRIARLWVARLLPVPDSLQPRERAERGWFWHEYDLRNPAEPAFRVLRSQLSNGARKVDAVTDAFAYDLAGGWLKHAVDRDGAPVMPGVKYDAQTITAAFDAWENLGLVEGTCNIGMLKTHWLHAMKSSSWRQKYGINVKVPGTDTDEAGDGRGKRREVRLDPSILFMLEQGDADGQPTVGTFEAPVDPELFLRSIHLYERDIIADSGLRSPSVQKMAGDPRSGQALEVDRDDERKLQARYIPSFGRSDRQLLRVGACMLNRANAGRAGYVEQPERGFDMRYHGVPKSPTERKLEREHLNDLVDRGQLDPVDMHRELNPGMTEEQAVASLLKIRASRERLGLIPARTTGPASPTE